MKKRILSLLLTITMCLSFISLTPANYVSAASTEKSSMTVQVQNFSDWAMKDLIVGDTYGIYPLQWYSEDMTAPITNVQLKKIIAETRLKMYETDEVIKKVDQLYNFKKYSKVETVLKYFYTMLKEFKFTKGIGLKDKTALEFMKTTGIYGSVAGEQKLTDRCSVEQACVIASRVVTYVYDQLDAGSKGFFYKTQSGKNTVYMLGSIHMASTEVYPLDSDILNAYAKSDALVEEINIFDMAGAMKVAQLGMYTDGTTLKDHVSDETYQKTMKLATKYGYSEASILSYKPWYIYSSFSALTGTESGDRQEAAELVSLGIDYNFLTNAYLTGKQVLEVEGYEYQGQVLDSFSDELEEYLLNSTIDSINNIQEGKVKNKTTDDLATMLSLWHEGDAESFAKFTSFEYQYPELKVTEAAKKITAELKEKILTNRDKGMADYIDSLLKSEGSNTYFVVVGSGHFVSDYDVLDILTQKGYTITQIK